MLKIKRVTKLVLYIYIHIISESKSFANGEFADECLESAAKILFPSKKKHFLSKTRRIESYLKILRTHTK